MWEYFLLVHRQFQTRKDARTLTAFETFFIQKRFPTNATKNIRRLMLSLLKRPICLVMYVRCYIICRSFYNIPYAGPNFMPE
jgi:hypothetical protein